MDEDKDYHFGASRASKILHRMYEAGYRGHLWEEMTELYAGWDTDASPTIQTRTSLPHTSSLATNQKLLASLVWAARVRTTRSQREAWACFLAYESSNAPVCSTVYLAMFEKLYYPQMKRRPRHKSQDDLDEVMKLEEHFHEPKGDLVPGDMKESLSDSTSPLHHVYLREPVPSIMELYHRMRTHNVFPSHRLLAFLLEAAPTFESFIDILEAAKNRYDGGIGHLLSGQNGQDSSVAKIPDHLLAIFIKCVCRYGQFVRTPQKHSPFLTPEWHGRKFRYDKHYLLDYAYALLFHYRPLYRNAWAFYLDKVVRSILDTEIYSDNKTAVKGRGITQYVIAWKIIGFLEEMDLDVDDQIFALVCTATTYAARAAHSGNASFQGARHVLQTGSPRLRKLFQSLVGANMDMQLPADNDQNSAMIPPHIPGPSDLHAYVRALGTLRDFEGLYSFSSWLTKYHKEVTARAEAQHSGAKLLLRMLVALRAALEGRLYRKGILAPEAPVEIAELIKAQIEGVEGWGWPGAHMVELYLSGGLRGHGMPDVGGR
tara:strand:+ start:12261 stop:13889 length:1629 start_codon:yes stop_codon:yes gene_type:complete